MKSENALVAILIAIVIISPSLPPAMASLVGGGHVTNTAPQVISVSIQSYPNQGTETNYHTTGGTPTSELNDDGDDYIEVTVVVYDANGEDDMTWINMSITEGRTLEDGTAWMSHQISSSDRSNSSDPGFQENSIHGYDNGTADNGYLTFKFKHTFDNGDDPANGAATSNVYTWQAEIKDSAGSTATDTDTVTVYNYADVDVLQAYYASDGSQNTSDYYWGNWSASSGDTDVPSKNYLKATNDGTANAGVTVTWSGANLENGSNTIPLTNLEVFEGEAATPASVGSWSSAGTGQNPSEMTVTHGEASQVISWVKHEIDIPAATPVGNYSQSFTFTVTSP